MSTNFSDRILGPDTHANRPAASGVPEGALYSCTDHSKVYRNTSGTWGDWLILGTPAADPLLYHDTLNLHAQGDDFDDASLTGWTLTGIAIPGDVTAVTTEPYDDTCLDVVFAAKSDRMLKAIPTPASGDFEISLTLHGIVAPGQMMGLVLADNAGTGSAVFRYSDNNVYLWPISAWGFTGSAVNIGQALLPTIAASNWPFVLKLKKVGTTITGSASYNGLAWATGSRTDSTTFTVMGIGAWHNAGGATSKLRLGRFNVEEL